MCETVRWLWLTILVCRVIFWCALRALRQRTAQRNGLDLPFFQCPLTCVVRISTREKSIKWQPAGGLQWLPHLPDEETEALTLSCVSEKMFTNWKWKESELILLAKITCPAATMQRPCAKKSPTHTPMTALLKDCLCLGLGGLGNHWNRRQFGRTSQDLKMFSLSTL